jgi:hypothetical protein
LRDIVENKRFVLFRVQQRPGSRFFVTLKVGDNVDKYRPDAGGGE